MINRLCLQKSLDGLGDSAANSRAIKAKGHMVEHVSRGEKNGSRVGNILESGSSKSVPSSRFENAVLG